MAEFAPMKNEKKIISLLIGSILLDTVDMESSKVDLSRNEFIIQCIEYALKNIKVSNGDNKIASKTTTKSRRKDVTC